MGPVCGLCGSIIGDAGRCTGALCRKTLAEATTLQAERHRLEATATRDAVLARQRDEFQARYPHYTPPSR